MSERERLKEANINRPSHTPFNGPILKEEISLEEVSHITNPIPCELRCPHNLMIMERKCSKND